MCSKDSREICLKVRIATMRTTGYIDGDLFTDSLKMLIESDETCEDFLKIICERLQDLREDFKKNQNSIDIDKNETPLFGDYLRAVYGCEETYSNSFSGRIAEEEYKAFSGDIIFLSVLENILLPILRVEELFNPEGYSKAVKKCEEFSKYSFKDFVAFLKSSQLIDNPEDYPTEWLLKF